MSKVFSVCLDGLQPRLVEVETSLQPNLPSMMIVGLPDKSVEESRERVKSALRNSGLPYPRGRIIVNLAPADLKKHGSGYDLPIAISVLVAQKTLPERRDAVFVGELSLAGELRSVPGIISVMRLARRLGIKQVFVPRANAQEAALVKGCSIKAIGNLQQVVGHLQGRLRVSDYVAEAITPFDEEDLFEEVWGQEHGKRALLVAAAGRHNLALIGPPGCGKTMLAKTMKGLLPALNDEAALAVTEIYSSAGLINPADPLIRQAPFRSPHHTATTAAILGGGQPFRPGEISLASGGVLHLDELGEFNRAVIAALREPLEEQKIILGRVNQKYLLPADFSVVITLNPCPCGYWQSQKICRCRPTQLRAYWQKISGPILDRIDMFVWLNPLPWEKINHGQSARELAGWRRQVEECLRGQLARGGKVNSRINFQRAGGIFELDQDCRKLMQQALERLNLSPRGYVRVLRVARTIADLEWSENIKPPHLGEALQYRFDLELPKLL